MIESPLEHETIIIVIQSAFHVHKLVYSNVKNLLISSPELEHRCLVALLKYLIDMDRDGIIESNLALLNQPHDSHYGERFGDTS
jgi:hypothetical protein